MSICIEKIKHDSCGSSDGLQVFYNKDEDKYTGFCFACSTFIEDPYGGQYVGKPKKSKRTKEDIKAELRDISTYPFLDLADRKLRKETLEYFRVRVSVSEQDGITPETHYYPYLSGRNMLGYKARLIKKKQMWSIGSIKDADLFNWFRASRSGAKRLYICEGEIDAMTVYQVLKDKNKNTQYKDNPVAVVSLPHGASSAVKSISKHIEDINRLFKEVIFVFDMDEAGESAAKEASKIIPRALTASLPEKDPNDCLVKGKSKALFNSLMFNAKKAKNTRIVWGKDIHDAAKKKAEWGLSYPWKSLTDATRGIRFGETIYIGAGEKMGKSEVLNALAAHLIKEHKLKVLLAKPEESNVKTYKMINSKICGRFFHDPKVEFDEKAYEEGGKIIKDKLCMLNLYQHIDWETLKSDIIYASSEGVKAVFIDPITNLVNGMDSSSTNTELQKISQDLSSLVMDLDMVAFIFCHLNKPHGGKAWDRGGKITTEYFAGSSAMARSCNYALGLEGNKDPELDKYTRNLRFLKIIADREYGESTVTSLYWDDKTGLFSEVEVDD